MGLFVKRNEVGNSTPFYTTSASKTVLVAGLGNPGKEYVGTRHNIGFEAIDQVVDYLAIGPWANKKDLKCQIATGIVSGTRVVAIKPSTFMNNSGEAVQSASHFYKIAPSDILVIHDELDIAFGKIRTSVDGSAAGHNGIKSVIAQMGQAFGRVRIGVGPKKPAAIDSADFVLAKFTSAQAKQVPDLCKEAVSIASDFIASGELFVETRSVII